MCVCVCVCVDEERCSVFGSVVVRSVLHTQRTKQNQNDGISTRTLVAQLAMAMRLLG